MMETVLDSLVTGGVSFEDTIDEQPEVQRWEGICSYGLAGVGRRHSSIRRACPGQNRAEEG